MVDINSSIKVLRELGGFCRADDFGLIEVYGKDDTRFLQAQTTNDVLALEQLHYQRSCLLDRKAHIQAYFDLYRRHESYRIIAEKTQIATIINHFDQHRVADKVDFLDLSGTGTFFMLQGPRCRRALNVASRSGANPSMFKPDVVDLRLWDVPVHLFQKSVTGEEGYFLWVANSDAQSFWKSFSAVAGELGFVELTDEVLEVARVEAGLPKFGVDFNSENFLPETGLEQLAVSYTKGCFLGQEVLARVKSQGAPTRGLVGLLFPPDARRTFPPGSLVLVSGEEAATLKSNVYSPMLDRVVAFASARRDYRAPDKALDVKINGEALSVTVSTLPFYQPEPLPVKARQIYEEALKLFATESDTEAESPAVELLREALELDPVFEDAYEALGVILSKRNRLDEAISLMLKLVSLNPDSVMAHTNLSVFYVEKGNKELAEEEKAISIGIRMRLAAHQASEEKQQKEKSAVEREAARERMEMFKQVLEIDAEDLLANYGVGSCYVALGEFAQAVPFLKKAIEVKPTYTVAYPCLGEAFEGLGKIDEAVDAYQRGIEVAAKRGDMQPLAQMQKRLGAINKQKQSEPVQERA